MIFSYFMTVNINRTIKYTNYSYKNMTDRAIFDYNGFA